MPTKKTGPAVVVNLGKLQFESHAREALDRAWRLSRGRPINAAHLLRGAILVGRGGRSQAFSKLASLLSKAVPTAEEVVGLSRPDLAAIPLEESLAESFFVAESFLTAGKRVWGRDYVTMALLAKDDPSLSQIAMEAGTTIEDLQTAWLRFVQSTDRHRTPEEWEEWWRAAGVGGGDGTARAAYLLTWNPSAKSLEEMSALVDRFTVSEPLEFDWSSGNRRSMEIGDRVFLLRQGSGGPRGLVGVGEVVREVQEEPHRKSEKREAGRKSLMVGVRWSALSVEPFVDLSSLVSLTDERMLWASQAGGVAIDEDIRDRLESIWRGAWARHRRGLEGVFQSPVEPKRLIARFDSDRGAVDDSLNIDRYVSAFARVMASRELVPPLSIGLFGDWGTGKTFFMDRLYDKVWALSGDESEESDLYWSNI